MKISVSLAVVGLFAASLTLPALAKDDAKVPDHKLDEFKLGKVIHGEKDAAKNLKGKVVVLEMWGIR